MGFLVEKLLLKLKLLGRFEAKSEAWSPPGFRVGFIVHNRNTVDSSELLFSGNESKTIQLFFQEVSRTYSLQVIYRKCFSRGHLFFDLALASDEKA